MILHNLVALIGILFFLYCLYALVFYIIHPRMVFANHKVKIPQGVIEQFPEMEIIPIQTDYGKTESWLLPPLEKNDDNPSPLIIIAHGNGTIIDYWPKRLDGIRDLGFSVLLVEYPGYGRSNGKPSEEAIEQALVRAYDSVVTRDEIDSDKVIMLGRSLGGGAICSLARQRKSAGLILLSTFYGVKPFARKYLLPKIVMGPTFDNLNVVDNYDNPILILHGKNDTVIPLLHATRLHSTARHSELIIYDCNHFNCPPDWDNFWMDITPFLLKCEVID